MPRPEPQPHTQPRVGVVTVSYGSGEALADFLPSLRRFHSDQLAVAVVDNKPDDENVASLAEQYGATYVPLPKNPGYGAGMNAGVAALEVSRVSSDSEGSGPIFDAYFFCNPDVEFTEETVSSLATVLLDGERIGSIGPRQLREDGTVYPSARNIPSFGTGVGHAIFGRVWPRNPWSRAYTAAANYDSPRPAGSLSGAAVMVSAEAYREIGGWDEAYFLHFEDIDLGWRLGQAGYENRYEPAVSLIHTGAHSTRKHAAAVERAMTRSAIRFMRKRYPGFWQAPLRWVIVAGLRVRGWIKLRAAKH